MASKEQKPITWDEKIMYITRKAPLNGLHFACLKPFEQKFVREISHRLETLGIHAYLSDKQEKVLDEIVESVESIES